MSWADKDFEEKMRTAIDAIYIRCFNGLTEIKRIDRGKEEDQKILFLDKNMAIDTYLTFVDGSVLTVQEKTLRHFQQSWQQFTFEYYNDPHTGEKGEWFKLAAQIYFFGYANEKEDSYLQYWILDISRLRIFLKNVIGIQALKSGYLRKNKPPNRANFFAIPFDIIEQDIRNIIVKG